MASVSPLRAFGAPRVQHPFEGKVDTRRRRKLKDIARALPRTPGVYFFYGFNDRLLYVGKAKCLRERVRSYFGETKIQRPPKIRRLLAEITRLDYRRCGSELEALLVERRLIAELRPILNHQHKRFEVYPYLLLSDEAFPRLTLTRAEPVGEEGDPSQGAEEPEEEDASEDWLSLEKHVTKALHYPRQIAGNGPLPLETPPRLGELPGVYLGPFTTPRAAFWTLEAVRDLFPLRTCEGVLKPDPNGRACFYYEIGRCCGPCVGATSREEYSRLCEELLRLLRTGDAAPLQQLRERMTKLATEWRFEEAAKIKEQLEAIEMVAARVRRLERMRSQNNVVIIQPAFQETGEESPGAANCSVFFVQGGVVRRHCTVHDWSTQKKNLKSLLCEVYEAPPPVAPFTGKSELDEMMILDRWLRAHGQEPCCVWMNERSRCWTAVTLRRLEAWAGKNSA